MQSLTILKDYSVKIRLDQFNKFSKYAIAHHTEHPWTTNSYEENGNKCS